jgi:hypothetical protein
MTRGEHVVFEQLIRAHGYAELVRELAAHAARKAHEVEQATLDPREHAEWVGELMLESEILGNCANHLTAVEGA